METETTYFAFVDMNLKVTRPLVINSRDKDIGTRAYELLKGEQGVDDWTEEVDAIIKEHNITFSKVSDEEMAEFVKKSQEVIARL